MSFLSLIIDSAKDVIKTDREQYTKYLKIIEEFASDHKLILGGDEGILLLIGDVSLIEQYTFYSDDAVRLTRELANEIFHSDPKSYGYVTSVISKIPDYLIQLNVNCRQLAGVFIINYTKGISVEKIILPSKVKGPYSGKELYCLSPEIQLISLYSKLINPAFASDWEKLLGYEDKLRKLFTSTISGGRIFDSIESHQKFSCTNDDCICHEECFQENITDGGADAIDDVSITIGGMSQSNFDIVKDIIIKYLSSSERILVGQLAIYGMNKNSKRIQVVSCEPLEKDIELIKSLGLQHDIVFQELFDNPKIPIDPKLRKVTLSIITKDRREPVIDIYNCGAYELLSYDLDEDLSIKFGSKFTIAKFRLVDLWIIKLILEMEKISREFANSIINEIIIDYKYLFSSYAISADIYKDIKFCGHLEDREISLKRLMSDKKYPYYYPASNKQ